MRGRLWALLILVSFSKGQMPKVKDICFYPRVMYNSLGQTARAERRKNGYLLLSSAQLYHLGHTGVSFCLPKISCVRGEPHKD